MEYKTKFAPVHAEGLGEVVDVGIEMSGKAFRSLIDAIYSRKIEAPIRELTTNALDSHIEAGIIKPFDIHLPTVLDSTFYVRDYGVSMTHEFVTTRFNTLFDSTKDGAKNKDVANCDPNKTVGSWGLGSKSPFAYTDALTMTCWLDGEIRIYTIFIGDEGKLKVAPVHSGQTDQQNGVKIEFAVKPSDIEEFEEAAIRVFKGFNILPNGLPTKIVNEVSVKPQHIGSFFKCFPSEYLGRGFFARQGCVLYPIDLDKIDTDTTGFNALGLSIVLDFPIGSIEYTNSREFLAYTEATIDALTRRFIEFRDEIEAGVNTAFAAVTNKFERARMAGSSDLFSLARFSFLSSAHKARDDITNAFNTFLPDRVGRNYYYKSGYAKCAIDRNGDRARQRAYSFAGGNFPERVGLILLNEETKTGTLKTSAPTDRVTAWLEAQSLDYAYVFETLPPLSILRQAGFPPITRMTDIPKVPKAPREYTGGGGFARFAIPEEDIPDDALYVFKNRGEWVDRDGSHLLHSTKTMIRQVAELLGRKIVTINIRSNDKLDRWASYDFAYDYTMDDVIESLTDEQVKALIAIINWRRFKALTIHDVIDKLTRAEVLHLTPLASLARFRDAKLMAKRSHAEIIDRLYPVLQDTTSDDDEIINQIIELARPLGCELLMPPREGERGTSQEWDNQWVRLPLETNLIPKVPQMFLRIIATNRLDNDEVAYITKEVFTK